MLICTSSNVCVFFSLTLYENNRLISAAVTLIRSSPWSPFLTWPLGCHSTGVIQAPGYFSLLFCRFPLISPMSEQWQSHSSVFGLHPLDDLFKSCDFRMLKVLYVNGIQLSWYLYICLFDVYKATLKSYWKKKVCGKWVTNNCS